MGCAADSPCIGLEVDDEGVLVPTWIFAPDSNVSCGAAGLIAPKLMHSLACDQTEDVNVIPNYGSVTTVQGPILTIANPSATRQARLVAAILFGTVQLDIAGAGGEVIVSDVIGVAGTGGLVDGSYTVMNTESWNCNPTMMGGTTLAFNNTSAVLWTCPTPVNPGDVYDVTFQRRVTLAGSSGGFGQALLRRTYLFAWMVAGSPA